MSSYGRLFGEYWLWTEVLNWKEKDKDNLYVFNAAYM